MNYNHFCSYKSNIVLHYIKHNMSNKTAETFIYDTSNDKKDKVLHPVKYYVKFSFVMTYILLMTTATITFIEALRTPNPQVRHVLNLETCISLVAGYFYSVFTNKIEEYGKENKPIDWADITKTRYIDWSITTPLMLLTLCIVLGMESKVPTTLSVYSLIVLLNYIMLYTGYLGEIQWLTRLTACIIGFIAFFLMFGIIFVIFVKPKMSRANLFLYSIYLCVWSVYGIAFLFNEEYKNIIMNILDFIAKCFIGIGLWAYYTKTIHI